MKKILFALLIAFAVIGCDKSSSDSKDDPTPTGSFSFLNGENGKLTLAAGKYEAVSIKGEDVTKLYFESSNPDVAEVVPSEGVNYIVAYAEGTATITAYLTSDPTNYATLQVTVENELKTIRFSQVYWMQASEDWQDKSHLIIRKRYYRGIEIPDGGDAQLKGDYTHEGDTANIQSWIDDVQTGFWYYLYTDEEGDSIGIFTDSIKAVRSWLLSTDAYFTGEGEFAVAGAGALFEYTDFYMNDGKYAYCLGTRSLVDDVTAAGKQYVKSGQQPKPYPGAIQVGHFDQDTYLDYFDHLIQGIETDANDYKYYSMYDSYFTMYMNVTYSDGSTGIAGFDLGYANVSQNNEYDADFYLASDDATGWFKMEYYYIEATLFLEYYNYQLAVEGDDFKYPLEFGSTMNFTYTGGEMPMNAPAKKGVRRHTNEMPVRTASMNKQMSFANTIGATFRMVLSTAK